jgi:catechol 2,3-dioxygenase-like lactoylglutathione lyase family enzyme
MKSSLNHISINVADKSISFPFYKELLAYLGYEIGDSGEFYFGAFQGGTSMWFEETSDVHKDNKFHRKATGLNHIAFMVSSKEDVDKFYEEFLKPKNMTVLYGSPKHYPEYRDDYYSVFFECPDRIKLEVCFFLH